jgi:hypothetical protein
VETGTDLDELVRRRGMLKSRMLELRATSPDDHDGFLRTVDQLMAVSDRIVDLVSNPPPAPEPGAEAVVSPDGDPAPPPAHP